MTKRKKRKKLKLHQQTIKKNIEKSEEETCFGRFLNIFLIIIIVLVFISLLFGSPLPRYNYAKGWTFYEWFLERQPKIFD